MKLTDCVLDAGNLLIPPSEIPRPRQEWLDAREQTAIPESLFQLYTASNFLSLDSIPSFLSDPQYRLFGYYGLLLRSLRDLGVEALEELKELEVALQEGFTPVKKALRQQWDQKADYRARKHLKHVLVACSAMLDNAAELVALFFPGKIKSLRVGKADFFDIQHWLEENAFEQQPLIISPEDYFLQEIHESLKPLILSKSSDAEWYPLMRLLRNKLAHTGHRLFFPSFHDAEANFYTFIPRRWPFIKEQFLYGPHVDGEPTLAESYRTDLIHQDLAAFTRGLRQRTLRVVDAICGSLQRAYQQFQSMPLNEDAIIELSRNAISFPFEFFPESEA